MAQKLLITLMCANFVILNGTHASHAQGLCDGEMAALEGQLREEDRQFSSVLDFFDGLSFEIDDLLADYFELEGRDHSPLAVGTFDGLGQLNDEILFLFRQARESSETLRDLRLKKITDLKSCLNKGALLVE